MGGGGNEDDECKDASGETEALSVSAMRSMPVKKEKANIGSDDQTKPPKMTVWDPAKGEFTEDSNMDVDIVKGTLGKRVCLFVCLFAMKHLWQPSILWEHAESQRLGTLDHFDSSNGIPIRAPLSSATSYRSPLAHDATQGLPLVQG